MTVLRAWGCPQPPARTQRRLGPWWGPRADNGRSAGGAWGWASLLPMGLRRPCLARHRIYPKRPVLPKPRYRCGCVPAGVVRWAGVDGAVPPHGRHPGA